MSGRARRGGWTPVLFRPKDSRVLWVEFGERRFDEAFFSRTINRALEAGARRMHTDLRTLETVGARHPGLRPTGFIFHLSRCGSTLLANMLGALPQCLVVRESEGLNQILLGDVELPEPRKRTVFSAFVNGLAQPRFGERHFFIKWPSWTILHMPFLKRLYPDVPWLFLYRDPVEVMASNFKEPHQRWLWEEAAIGVRRRDMAGMSWAELCARALAGKCEAALRFFEPGRSLVASYARMKDPGFLPGVLRFFSVQASAPELARMERTRTVYSKDPKAKRAFEDDSARKRRAAPPALRRMAREWLSGPVARLDRLERRCWDSAGSR